MNNLDELMRKKFDTANNAERFEFQEQYWEQARALIEADERKRKRRRALLWWWMGAGLIFAIWATLSPFKAQIKGNDAATRQTQQQGPNGNAPIPAGPAQATGDNAAFAPKISATANDADKKGEGQAGQNARQIGNKNSQGQTGNVAISGANSAGKTQKNAVFSAKEGHNTAPDAQNPIAAWDGKPSNAASNEAPAQNPTQEEGREASSLVEKAMTPSLLNKTEQGIKEIPLLGFWLLQNEAVRGPFAQLPQTPVTKVSKTKPFQAHVYGSIAQITGKNRSAALGLGAAYRLPKGFFLQTELGWRYLPTAFDIDSTQQPLAQNLRYSFGYQQDKIWLTRMGQHLVEWPIGLGWQYKGLRVQSGLHVAMRLAVRATLSTESNTTLNPQAVVSTQSFWLANPPPPRLWARPYMGVGYELGRIGLQAKAIWLPDFSAPATDANPQKGRPPMLDFGLRWRF